MQAITHPGTGRSPGAAADLKQWRSAIAQGNRAFEKEDYVRAARHYRLARSIADRLFGFADEVDAGVAALVIAHHNLADTYERLGQFSEQGSQLCAVHERLCRSVDDRGLNEPWRSAALRHSRRTYVELVRFAGRQPEHARARAALSLGAAGPGPESPAH